MWKILNKTYLLFIMQKMSDECGTSFKVANSVTILGDLLDFGQLLKTFGNNLFLQISHYVKQFL